MYASPDAPGTARREITALLVELRYGRPEVMPHVTARRCATRPSEILGIVASRDGKTLYYGEQQVQANFWLVRPSPLGASIPPPTALDECYGWRTTTEERISRSNVSVKLARSIGLRRRRDGAQAIHEQAMRDGGFVVAVAAPTDERKERAADVLRKHGAHSINFLGRFLVEGMDRA